MFLPDHLWFIIAKFLGEESIALANLFDDSELGEAIYQIAEDHHLASLEMLTQLDEIISDYEVLQDELDRFDHFVRLY